MPKGTPSRRPCSIDGCAEMLVARGWCSKHYQRWRQHGDPLREPDYRRKFWTPQIDGEIARVPLSQGLWATIDLDDLPMVEPFGWFVAKPSHSLTCYATAGRSVGLMHRFLLGLKPGDPGPDHIDRDGLNNRRSNLRPSSPSQNGANQPSRRGSSSRYKGVSWSSRDRVWVSCIKVDRKYRRLGSFRDEEAAARAYDAAALEAWPEHAYVNFPEDCGRA